MKDLLSSLNQRTITAGQAVLAENKQGILAQLPFLGPAVIASVAYMDPGNFATNIQGGAQFGYTLLWVVLLANLIAMLFQSLSAKLGIVTGKSLAENIRDRLPKPLVYFMWIASECAAMATDLAEVLGASIGLTLLFGLPLFVSCIITGIVTYIILLLQGTGFRPMEIVIATFVSAISLSYVAELFIATPQWGLAAYHTFVPQLMGPDSIMLAVGIVGATVMPHALYLHSSLTKDRIPTKNDEEKKKVLRFSNNEVLGALAMAGLVNMAMLTVSAVVFYYSGNSEVADIETAYHTLTPLMGISAAGIFMLSLLASGFSSSVVGTMAGQTIMQDFVNFRIPLWFRRAITLIPAFIVVWMGVNVTDALVVSQVVLSLILPIPLISLLYLTSRKDLMGVFANKRITNVGAVASGIVVLALNILLLTRVAGVELPFIG